MGWRPNMTNEERARLNASRRKSYGTRRHKQGKPYTPSKPIPMTSDALAILRMLAEGKLDEEPNTNN